MFFYTFSKMKLSSSSSSAPPPSSSFSFDSKSAVSGCFAGILHRILCSRSLPTYPSDQITESCSIVSRDQELEETKQNDREYQAVAAPGVVARLMGLESMPNMGPDLITRTRSMNSLDCCNKGSSMDQMEGGHRRVKSSTFSVSEIPAFLELEENEDFLVLNFENGSEEETKRRRRKISSSRRKKPDTTTTTTTTSSLPGFENPECSTPVKNKKEESESENVKFRKKKKKMMKKYVENDSSSEDSSPVSVLDFDRFITDHEVPRSELDSNLVESNSRRKLSPELGELEYYENRIRRNDSNLMISDEDTNAKKSGSRNSVSCSSTSWQRQSNYMEMWDQIWKMTDEAEEEEIIGGSKWWFLKKHHHEEFEQICADFELQIVDQSLDELVQQLVGLIT